MKSLKILESLFKERKDLTPDDMEDLTDVFEAIREEINAGDFMELNLDFAEWARNRQKLLKSRESLKNPNESGLALFVEFYCVFGRNRSEIENLFRKMDSIEDRLLEGAS